MCRLGLLGDLNRASEAAAAEQAFRYDTAYVYVWDAPSPRDITGGVWSDYRYRYRVRPVGDLEADPQFGVGGAAYRCTGAVVLERFDWAGIG
jgi:hypothetical protein